MVGEGRDAIIFLDKNRIFVYDGNEILRLDVPETVIRDIDIIDKSGFDSLVDTFIKTRKLASVQVWLVLADGICFSKDVIETDPLKIEGEIKDFLEAVPFDKVISKRYRAGGGIRVIATNLEYIEAVMEIFEKEEFVMEGIVPGAMFPGFNTRKVLDADFARYILENKNLMKTGNMLTKVTLPSNTHETTETPKKSKLLLYLIGGFVILLIILVVAIMAGR
jgi:hypothetical protein